MSTPDDAAPTTEASASLRPGPFNALSDVAGLAVGQAEDQERVTGVTVVLAERPAVAAASVMGGGPGTRSLSQLAPGAAIDRVDAIALSGGSAFGLDAAGGVMDWLRLQGRGVEIGTARVPIVPGAVIFDLLTGSGAEPTGWDTPPWWALGRKAAAAARAHAPIALGNHGAGLGAKAGRLKGGTGTASLCLPDDGPSAPSATVAALVIANPLGEVVMPGSNAFWAHPFEIDGEFGAAPPPKNSIGAPDYIPPHALPGANTTLAVIATDLDLTRAECLRLALMGQDGLARAIRPVHSPLDGDTVFALATARRSVRESRGGTGVIDTALLTRLGMMAADCVTRATAHAVHAAEAHAGYPAWRDLGRDGHLMIKKT